MIYSSKKLHLIFPDWRGIIISGICAAISFFFMATNLEVLYPKIDMWYLFAISILCLITQSKCYVIRADYFLILLIGIPVRKIAWKSVMQIVMLRDWKYGSHIQHQEILVFTIKPCPPFQKNTQTVGSYFFHHPLGSLIMKVPAQKGAECIAAIEKCYGPIDADN